MVVLGKILNHFIYLYVDLVYEVEDPKEKVNNDMLNNLSLHRVLSNLVYP